MTDRFLAAILNRIAMLLSWRAVAVTLSLTIAPFVADAGAWLVGTASMPSARATQRSESPELLEGPGEFAHVVHGGRSLADRIRKRQCRKLVTPYGQALMKA
jgi:hypothetical protein